MYDKAKLQALLSEKHSLEAEARRLNNHYSDEPTTEEWQVAVDRISAIEAEIEAMNLPTTLPHNAGLWSEE